MPVAKSKSTRRTQDKTPRLSPEKFMATKARTLPVGRCMATEGWPEAPAADVVVTRLRPSGNLAAGFFTVDRAAGTVTAASFDVNLTPRALDERLSALGKMTAVGYGQAHNFIWGAVEFAMSRGIRPPESMKTAAFILAPDDEAVPLIEYTFGYDIAPTAPTAVTTLYNKEATADQRMTCSQWADEQARHPREPFIMPEAKAAPEIAPDSPVASLFDPALRWKRLDRELAAALTAGPRAESRLAEVVAAVIARNDNPATEPRDWALRHALTLLADTASPHSTRAALQVARQSPEWVAYTLGDEPEQLISDAVFAGGAIDLDAVAEFIHTPGVASDLRACALTALARACSADNPSTAEAAMRLLESVVKELPRRVAALDCADARLAAHAVWAAAMAGLTSLLPDIKALFDADAVDRSIALSFSDVHRALKNAASRAGKSRKPARSASATRAEKTPPKGRSKKITEKSKKYRAV